MSTNVEVCEAETEVFCEDQNGIYEFAGLKNKGSKERNGR